MPGKRIMVWLGFCIFFCAVLIAVLSASPHRVGGGSGLPAAMAKIGLH